VPPEINFGGKMLVTADFLREDPRTGNARNHDALNLSDSSLLLGFSKYLFTDSDYGFAVIGIKVPDDETDLKDDIYLHQAHAGIGGKRYELLLGRSRLTNTLISFPTVREEDLLQYTHVANGQSNARADEYHIFGGLRAEILVSPALDGRRSAPGADRDRPADPEQYLGSKRQLQRRKRNACRDVPEAIKFDRGCKVRGHIRGSSAPRCEGASPRETKAPPDCGITCN
jgi:hypothetical protein